MRYVNEYEIIMKDGKVEVSKYGFNHSNNEKKRILEKSKECTKEQILKLINDCHLMSWDSFYGKHPKGVRDGTMFNFNAIVNGNRHITASGSQNFPKNYKVFVQWIYELFN